LLANTRVSAQTSSNVLIDIVEFAVQSVESSNLGETPLFNAL